MGTGYLLLARARLDPDPRDAICFGMAQAYPFFWMTVTRERRIGTRLLKTRLYDYVYRRADDHCYGPDDYCLTWSGEVSPVIAALEGGLDRMPEDSYYGEVRVPDQPCASDYLAEWVTCSIIPSEDEFRVGDAIMWSTVVPVRRFLIRIYQSYSAQLVFEDMVGALGPDTALSPGIYQYLWNGRNQLGETMPGTSTYHYEIELQTYGSEGCKKATSFPRYGLDPLNPTPGLTHTSPAANPDDPDKSVWPLLLAFGAPIALLAMNR